MTKEKFNTYVRIQMSGITNMFDVTTVVRLSKGILTEEDCFDIMEHYSKYKNEFSNN